MHNDEIWEQGLAQTVLDKPKTPELRSFLGAVLV
jgi:ABC-type phosphonate transport system ATPase subunit|tara:strand:+ start:514 stop:615 length:102 start_codon:yes stop_codon:yes gene_type:complete